MTQLSSLRLPEISDIKWLVVRRKMFLFRSSTNPPTTWSTQPGSFTFGSTGTASVAQPPPFSFGATSAAPVATQPSRFIFGATSAVPTT